MALRHAYERILVVKLSAIGDIVHTPPAAVAALRRAYPEAWLAWLVERAGANLLRGNPDLDELIVDTHGWRANWWVGLRHAWYVTRHLRRASFDLCIDFQGLFKSAVRILQWRTATVGFPRQMCREPLSTVFTNMHGPLVDPRVHVVDQSVELLQALDVATTERRHHSAHRGG